MKLTLKQQSAGIVLLSEHVKLMPGCLITEFRSYGYWMCLFTVLMRFGAFILQGSPLMAFFFISEDS